MEQRVSVITLGVRDLERSRGLYEALGWQTGAAAGDDVVFFAAGAWSSRCGTEPSSPRTAAWRTAAAGGGVTLAHNVRSPAEVDAVVEEARAAGAQIAREPGETFWGGYSAALLDPDGHPWEIAHNPRWALGEDGSVELPA